MDKEIQNRSEVLSQLDKIAGFLCNYRSLFHNLAEEPIIDWEDLASAVVRDWENLGCNLKSVVDWFVDNPEEYRESVKATFTYIEADSKEFLSGWKEVNELRAPKGWRNILTSIVFPIDANLRYLKKWLGSYNNPITDEGKNAKSKRGAKPREFKDCIIHRYADQTQEIITKMRQALKGTRGKSAVAVIASAVDLGYIKVPTYAEFDNEFKKEDGKSLISGSEYKRMVTDVKKEDLIRKRSSTEIKKLLNIYGSKI